MRRLNGRQQTLRYLGRSPRNRYAWRKIQVRYGEAIHCWPGSGHVWARSEGLDAVDIREGQTMAEVLDARRANREPVGEAVGGYPREYLKLLKRLLKTVGAVTGR